MSFIINFLGSWYITQAKYLYTSWLKYVNPVYKYEMSWELTFSQEIETSEPSKISESLDG